jgi:hypothetical protein
MLDPILGRSTNAIWVNDFVKSKNTIGEMNIESSNGKDMIIPASEKRS